MCTSMIKYNGHVVTCHYRNSKDISKKYLVWNIPRVSYNRNDKKT